MLKEDFLTLYNELIKRGYEEEIDWSENLQPCTNFADFCREYIWVILNAGMKNQVARKIYNRVIGAITENKSANDVFHHKGKAGAIDYMYQNCEKVFQQYQTAQNKLQFLEGLPWIGQITKYHLAKNLGFDTAKPDRHLVRIAKQFDMTCFELCKKLSKEMGLRIATIDVVLWRAANLGLI
ncbi:MAG: hypothetical protein E3J94_07000 [Desulfobacteraceae bacterium]|nr:MAG: hypothetical protein E3J94_07000 [Desulfobacteraceae bacterium]